MRFATICGGWSAGGDAQCLRAIHDRKGQRVSDLHDAISFTAIQVLT
jgi:hypothetical protein